MKLAIISVTIKGADLGERLRNRLKETFYQEIDLYAKARATLHASTYPYDSLSELISAIFRQYDGIIFIMATGIVVRVIAPHIRDKRSDPAVVVMDDAGIHSISLLSGHLGGANELAEHVAAAVGARPVITTATDIANLPAPDVLAVKLDLVIEPFGELKAVNAAIVNGEKVLFYIDNEIAYATRYIHWAAEMGVELIDMKELSKGDEYDAAVIITDKELYMPKLHVYLRPATLAAGIGCRKGTTSAEIFAALHDACRKIGRSCKSLAVIGSSVVKQEEIGLLAAAQQLEIPLEFYSNEHLQEIIQSHNLETSKFVEEEIGVGNVCEPAALLGGRQDVLLLSKTKYPKVAVAIAEVKYRWWESDQVVEQA